jgi:acetoin utilization deacetylase AcuC-like enzyme
LLVVPLARRYRPELLLVSAGYDAHLADPLSGMAVSTAGFSEMARTVRLLADEIEECGGRVAAILEEDIMSKPLLLQ